MIRRLAFTLMLACACLTLSGCGKKGNPGSPEGEKTDFPRKYPAPS
jgi:predicted small lipoprotein YifL